MTAPAYEVLHGRLVLMVEEPDFNSRRLAVQRRVTPSLCWRCLGLGSHFSFCTRPVRVAASSTREAFGNAVARVVARIQARDGLKQLMADLWAVMS